MFSNIQRFACMNIEKVNSLTRRALLSGKNDTRKTCDIVAKK